MTWHPRHPGGYMTCDVPGCTRERRAYCTPEERDTWTAYQVGSQVHDRCPDHPLLDGDGE